MIVVLITQKSFADADSKSNTKTIDKPQVPLVDGISKRLIPEQSQTITFPETAFSFGIYREFLWKDTQNNYTATGIGVLLGFDQHIRGMWSGGLEMRWSDWKSKQRPNSNVENTSPLSFFSKVTASPNLTGFIDNKIFTNMVRPYMTGGVGYTVFFDQRSYTSVRSKTAFGQLSATYGVGLKINMPSSIAVKFGAEGWRGLADSSYFSNIVYFALSFGDVDKF